MDRRNNTIEVFSDVSSHVAKMVFFTKGKGLHKDNLTSFELALREAAISDRKPRLHIEHNAIAMQNRS